jgi:hypothetical protein
MAVDRSRHFDREMHRLLRSKFNYSEPPAIGKITRVDDDTVRVSVLLNGMDTPIPDVPVIMPPGYDWFVDIAPGDEVLVIFPGGDIGNPYVLGVVATDFRRPSK